METEQTIVQIAEDEGWSFEDSGGIWKGELEANGEPPGSWRLAILAGEEKLTVQIRWAPA